MLKIVIYLVNLQVVTTSLAARCLRGCSGHGTCGTAGYCNCEMPWAGRDCSLHLNFLQDSFEGSWSACIDSCSGHGTCSEGVCSCFPGWTGTTCAIQDHCPPDCRNSGGTCISGMCVCKIGSFGPGCQDQICPNDCGGHGICMNSFCYCVHGWRGLQCEFHEFSLPHAKLAVHSSAVMLTQSQAITGFHHAGAGHDQLLQHSKFPTTQEQTSEFSLTEVQENETIADHKSQLSTHPASYEDSADLQPLGKLKSLGQQIIADSHRTIASVIRTKAFKDQKTWQNGDSKKAAKDVGGNAHDQLAGKVASKPTALPAEGDISSVFNASVTHVISVSIAKNTTRVLPHCPHNCSGHGVCNSTSQQCLCTEGYTGDFCDVRRCVDDCNGHGLCMNGMCICDESHYGRYCAQTRCEEDCSGRGYCFQGQCQCTEEWVGTACKQSLFRGRSTTRIIVGGAKSNLRGTPSVEVSTIRASAKLQCPGNCSSRGVCNGKTCTCDAGFFGSDCSQYCPDSCSGHGDCVQGACLCLAGYSGPSCNEVDCCSGHGSCSGNSDKCTCDAGWAGTECSIELVCPDPMCSGHGACVHGQCICSSGYIGADCSTSALSCEGLCGDHGQCNSTTASCKCAHGWTGPRCDIEHSRCPNNCSGHDTCFSKFCA